MKHTSYLVRIFWLLMLVFFVGRIGFMSYNAALWPSAADPAVAGFSGGWWLKDIILTCFYGAASHDLLVVAALLAVPALLSLCGVKRLRLWLTPYYIIMGISVAVIIVADAVMYEFWQFKLSSVVLAYAAYPEGTANSVSTTFVATRLGAGVLLMALIIGGCIWLTPRRSTPSSLQYRLTTAAFTLLAVAAVAVPTGGLGSVYKSDRLFLNHAAVNPVLGFVSSCDVRPYADRFDTFDDTRLATNMQGLYPATPTLTDTLLNTRRPDVLVVFVESFGSEFVTSLGGARGTTPKGHVEDVDQQFERLIPEGIFWTNYYSNSFRTDRGTVSAFCGWPSYPDVGLMTHTEYHAQLPSLPRSMQRAGYTTSYLYPGPTTNMGKGTFLRGIGFQQVLDDKAFSATELDSPWGAHDLTSARKVASIMSRPAAKPRLFCYQTVSSHESWDVPYARLTDKVQNAFAYTDAAIGTLVDSLKHSPVWDNLLIVIIPDHGHLYNVPADQIALAKQRGAKGGKSGNGTGKAANGTKGSATPDGPLHHQAFDDPEFFHSPMLWLGGAIKQPRRMDVLMNQSDLCATLLAQLGIDHKDYPWSRNVLSLSYTYPFVYSTFPAGILFRDATGTTLYDTTADRIILQDEGGRRTYGPQSITTDAARERLERAKSILQSTYDGLNQR